MSGPQRGITCTKALATVRWRERTTKMPPGPPKPPAHEAALALRQSDVVMWMPSHPCNAQQIVAAGNELALDCRSFHVGQMEASIDALRAPHHLFAHRKDGRMVAEQCTREVAEHHDEAGVERRQPIPM